MDCDGERDIRTLIESWMIWRDTGNFDRLAGAWHPGGTMVSTLGEVSAAEFVATARRLDMSGLNSGHSYGGCAIEIVDDRAVAHSRVTITLRATVENKECDVEAQARFVDLLERRKGRWGIVLRHPAYDRDRIMACDGSALPALDQQRLARFPAGYRHVAYVQSSMGLAVRDDLPGRNGAAMDALLARAELWLGRG